MKKSLILLLLSFALISCSSGQAAPSTDKLASSQTAVETDKTRRYEFDLTMDNYWKFIHDLLSGLEPFLRVLSLQQLQFVGRLSGQKLLHESEPYRLERDEGIGVLYHQYSFRHFKGSGVDKERLLLTLPQVFESDDLVAFHVFG